MASRLTTNYFTHIKKNYNVKTMYKMLSAIIISIMVSMTLQIVVAEQTYRYHHFDPSMDYYLKYKNISIDYQVVLTHNIALNNNKYEDKTIQTTDNNIIATITSQLEVQNLLKLLSNGHSIKFEQNIDEKGNHVIHIIGVYSNTDSDDNNYNNEYTEKGNIVVI